MPKAEASNIRIVPIQDGSYLIATGDKVTIIRFT